MISSAIFWISSGIMRSPFFSGTSAPSTRNIGGKPDFRWMSEAPPLMATFRMSLSAMPMSVSGPPPRVQARVRR